MLIILIITFILVLLITVFGFQNGMPLDVKFLFWNIHTSLIAVIFGSSLVGALIVAILAIPKLVTKHFKEKKLTKQLNQISSISSSAKTTSPPGPDTTEGSKASGEKNT